MIEIREIKEEDTPSIKEDHVLSCFMDYLHHKHAPDLIQEELTNIAAELSSGFTSTGITRTPKDKGSYTPWRSELLAGEYELTQEQDKYEEAMEVAHGWLARIKNPDHKNIIVGYLINNRGENVEIVVDLCSISPSSVYEATRRLIKDFIRRIF